MTESTQCAHVIRVTRANPCSTSDSLILLYAVLTDTADDAVEAVRKIVADNVHIEPVGDVVLPVTAAALGLLPGQPRLL
jgi:hypothetical protein